MICIKCDNSFSVQNPDPNLCKHGVCEKCKKVWKHTFPDSEMDAICPVCNKTYAYNPDSEMNKRYEELKKKLEEIDAQLRTIF